MVKKKVGTTTAVKTESVKEPPVKQQYYQVGYKRPPQEHRFKKGQSGNPSGPPVRRTQLWVYFCKYMNMTDADIEKLDRSKLTQSQQMALSLVEKEGKTGSRALALAIFDREEGKALERLKQDAEVQVLSVPVSRSTDEQLALLEEKRQFYLKQKDIPLGTAE